MQSELKKAARDFMFLFIVDGGDRGISLDDIDPMEFSQKFAALEAALSTGKMQEICSVSFADREAATVFLRDFTKSEGGLATVDWYALRDRIADKISMTRVEERGLCRTPLSAPAKTPSEDTRNKARSAVVSAYNSLDCVTIPFSFLHAFADAAVDAVSRDVEPDGWVCENDFTLEPDLAWEWEDKGLSPKPFYFSPQQNAEPVKTAQAVAVKPLRWKGPDSSGEYHSLDGLWGYIIRAESVGGFWLTEIGRYFRSPKAAQAAAQADYETRIRSALSAQVQDEAGSAELIRMVDIAENRLVAIHKALHPGMHGINGIESPEDHVAYMVSVLQAAYDGVTASKHGDAE